MVPWAWERPEDLRFVGGDVAYLAQTITLRGSRVEIAPRRQPLRVLPSTRVIPVVRIEAYRPMLDDGQRAECVRAIESLRASEVQLDFDATSSQRPFYRALLGDLHRTIPHITITALASWCGEDRWLDGLPLDDAIPMLFRMGRDEGAVRASLARGDDFAEPRCRRSAGVSLDEPPPRIPAGRRLYVFNPRRWSPHDWRAAQEIARR